MFMLQDVQLDEESGGVPAAVNHLVVFGLLETSFDFGLHLFSRERRYPFASAVNDGGEFFLLVHQPLQVGVFRDAFRLGPSFQTRFIGERDFKAHSARESILRSFASSSELRASATGTDRWCVRGSGDAGTGRAGSLGFCRVPGAVS